METAELLERAADVLDLERNYYPSKYICGSGVCQVGAMMLVLEPDKFKAMEHYPAPSDTSPSTYKSISKACKALTEHHGVSVIREDRGNFYSANPYVTYVASVLTQDTWYGRDKKRIVKDMRELAAKLQEQPESLSEAGAKPETIPA